MTRHRLSAIDKGGVYCVRGWRAKELIAAAGIKPFFAGGGWVVDAARMPDLLAHLDRRHVVLDIAGGKSLPTSSQTSAPETAPEVDLDVPLWGSDGGAG